MPEFVGAEGGTSFRDPSGFVFLHQGVVHRQVNSSYQRDYELLVGSGLYQRLVDRGLLIAHEEVELAEFDRPLPSAYKFLRPEPISFISYPYEWCFSQLRDAAILTLAIQREAIALGMTLKDCTAYNVQFERGKAIFIDTLSFEEYQEGEPWVAYRQFCQHFLAPLALMSQTDIRLNQLSRTNLDGVPLDLAARLLPFRSRFSFSLAIHIHLHARLQATSANRPSRMAGQGKSRAGEGAVSRRALLWLVDHLETAVKRLRWNPGRSAWSAYDQEHLYAPETLKKKEEVVGAYLDQLCPSSVWDLGANTGRFSRVAADRGARVVAFDLDPCCVELNYRRLVEEQQTRILPLLLDVTNPSPGSGWLNRERASFLSRGPVDTVLALALVHHLAIANNLPLIRIAEFLREVGHSLVIEFVPKDDPQVARLLASREDVFPDYHVQGFERDFQEYFELEAAETLPNSSRVLYRMRARGGSYPDNRPWIKSNIRTKDS